jgi:hypothetical protein
LSAAGGVSAFCGATCAVCDAAVPGAVAGAADWASALVEMPATEANTNPSAKAQVCIHTLIFVSMTISFIK